MYSEETGNMETSVQQETRDTVHAYSQLVDRVRAGR